MEETRYQRIAREQAERQAARAQRERDRIKAEAKLLRATRSVARRHKRDAAFEDWATSDFPNQEDN